MKKYIVLITGSRSITERDKIFAKLDELLDPHEIETFIEGEAVGVDLISRDWCEINYVHVTPMEIPKNYHTIYGKGAGNQRNKDMLDKAMTLAKQKGLEVFGFAHESDIDIDTCFFHAGNHVLRPSRRTIP